jgi:hypothetical protein
MLALAPSHVQAMQEAAKHLAKSRTADTAQLAALQEASDRISRFVQAHSLIEQDPAAAVSLCQQLLQEAPEQVVSDRGALTQLLPMSSAYASSEIVVLTHQTSWQFSKTARVSGLDCLRTPGVVPNASTPLSLTLHMPHWLL